jgi:peptide deformylase
MIKELVHYTDKILHNKLEIFDFDNPPMDPSQLAHELAQTMIASHGLGLSANQIGYPYRVFVMTGNPITCCFNPKIVDFSEEELDIDEGCLSYPELAVKIKRSRVIRVRYTMANGELVTAQYQDMTARVFQHELDHLNGITMFDRCTYIEKERAKKRMKKIERERLKKKFHMPDVEV